LSDLNRFSVGSIVGPKALRDAGVIARQDKQVKIVGGGSLKHKLTVRIHAVTAGARAGIEAVGGKVEIIPERGTVKQ
jgi:large subunit ribosomal protein L15